MSELREGIITPRILNNKDEALSKNMNLCNTIIVPIEKTWNFNVLNRGKHEILSDTILGTCERIVKGLISF